MEGPRASISVSRGLRLCLRAVLRTVATVAEASTPQVERKPPETLRCTTDLRRACSEALLVVIIIKRHILARQVRVNRLSRLGFGLFEGGREEFVWSLAAR